MVTLTFSHDLSIQPERSAEVYEDRTVLRTTQHCQQTNYTVTAEALSYKRFLVNQSQLHALV